MGVPVTEYDRVNFGLGAEHMQVQTFTGAPKRYRDFISQYGNSNTGIGKYKGWTLKRHCRLGPKQNR